VQYEDSRIKSQLLLEGVIISLKVIREALEEGVEVLNVNFKLFP
jgi:hypothetical protein